MRRIITVIAAIAALVSCTQKYEHAVSGDIQGVEKGFLMSFYTSDGESGETAMDTIYIDNGKWFWDPCVEEPGIVMIVDVDHFVDNITLYTVPGESAFIKGTMADYTVTGSKFFQDWGKFHEMSEGIDQERKDLINTIPADEDEDYDMAEYSAKEREIAAKWNDAALEFVKANPDSDVSAYLIREMTNAEMVEEAVDYVSQSVIDGPVGHLIESRLILIDSELMRQSARRTVYEGAVAPDFSLKTSTGDTFTLSERRGKWVMLDFWGTWCEWCVEGLPTVKEIAHTYTDKLEVVSVDSRDPEAAWLKGIEKYGMDWTQVYNSEKDAIDSRYGVEGFPGFYLIDPEGVIKMIAFGEPAHFVDKIGELIGAK